MAIARRLSPTILKNTALFTLEQLLGNWEGIACTAYPDWKPSETYVTSLEIKEIGGGLLQQQLSFGEQTITSTGRIESNKLHFQKGALPRQILLLPDGTSSNTPLQVKLRQPFFVEVGWLVKDNERQRLIRSYNDKGEWISATHFLIPNPQEKISLTPLTNHHD